MLNSTECCHAIGCNCGGTILIETMNKIPVWIYPAIVIGVAGILYFIIWKFSWSNQDL
jgi:hypothetical protein